MYSAEIFFENERNWSLTKIQRKESRDIKARRAIIIFTIIKVVNSNTVDNLLNRRKTLSGHVNAWLGHNYLNNYQQTVKFGSKLGG